MTHARNARVMTAANLVDGMNLEQKDKKYDSAVMIFDSDNSDGSDYSNMKETPMQLLAKTPTEVELKAIFQQTRARDTDMFKKLCA